jgi:hypothetical protein
MINTIFGYGDNDSTHGNTIILVSERPLSPLLYTFLCIFLQRLGLMTAATAETCSIITENNVFTTSEFF